MEVAGLSQTIVAAQTTIATSYRSFKARQLVKARKYKVRISLSYENTAVYIQGSFLPPAWNARKSLSYSLASRELFVEAWLKTGDEFVFVKRGVTFVHPDFPTVEVCFTQNETQGIVNIFIRSDSILHSLPQPAVWNGAFRFRTGVAFRGKTQDHYEDAYFCTEKSVGIADGVSAWQSSGINSGLFAQSLMQQCSRLSPSRSQGGIRQELTDLLSEAHRGVQEYGSSTALLAHLVSGRLLITTVGDSRAALIRWTGGRPAVCFKSAVMVHSFNTPFQLANIPPHLQSLPFITDSPSEALHYSLSPQSGDLLLLGTDGLWDNIYDWELMQLLDSSPLDSPTELAQRLCSQAYTNSVSTTVSPFQQSASLWRGGKPDDITVLVAWVGNAT